MKYLLLWHWPLSAWSCELGLCPAGWGEECYRYWTCGPLEIRRYQEAY